MYCQRAGNDSERMFRELTLNGNPKSLESVLYCRAAQFVASTRAEKSAISVWWSVCSESADGAASESHSQLRNSALDADSACNIVWHSRAGKPGPSDLFRHGKCHELSD